MMPELQNPPSQSLGGKWAENVKLIYDSKAELDDSKNVVHESILYVKNSLMCILLDITALQIQIFRTEKELDNYLQGMLFCLCTF